MKRKMGKMKKIITIILLIVNLLLISTPVYALSSPSIKEITRGENSIRWDWYGVSDNIDGYIIGMWESSNINNSTFETVYGKTYYIQQNTVQGITYNAHIKTFKGDIVSSWGIGFQHTFTPDSAPIISYKEPALNESNVPIDKIITFYLSKKIREDLMSIQLKKGEGIVNANVYYNDSSKFIQIVPINNLEQGVIYTVYVSGLTDLVGQVSEPTSWSFTTKPATITTPSGGDSYAPPTIIQPTVINTPYAYTDISNHWAKDAIQTLVNKNLLPSDIQKFEPEKQVLRGDFTNLLIRAMNYAPTLYLGRFTDVSVTDLNANYIQTAYDKGIVQGISETEFAPNNPINREEIIAMFDRALKLKGILPTEVKPLTEFKDYQSISSWAVESAQNIYSLGLIKGKTDFANVIFDPVTNTSNAENATLIVRLLEKIESI